MNVNKGKFTPPPMVIVVDTREQTPFDFEGKFQTVPGTLQSGDYTIKGFEEHVAIERKSMSDLVGCTTTGRQRFKHELHRLRGFYCSAVIIECTVAEIIGHKYRSKVSPESVLGSCASWQVRYNVPFIWAGSYGARYCVALLRNYHRIAYAPLIELAKKKAEAEQIIETTVSQTEIPKT